MTATLEQFSENELRLTADQASRVIEYFFPSCRIPSDQITNKDRSFAQALLVEAIDSSYHMRYVDALFQNFYFKIPDPDKGVTPLIKAFAKQAMKIWFKHATARDLQDAQVYQSVRSSLSRNWRSEISTRMATGDYPTY